MRQMRQVGAKSAGRRQNATGGCKARHRRRRWRFGAQSAAGEKAEIRAALKAGRAEQYIRGQRWAMLIEAETARRRARKEPRG